MSSKSKITRACPKGFGSNGSLAPYDERRATISSTRKYTNNFSVNFKKDKENHDPPASPSSYKSTLSKEKVEALEDKVVRNIGRTFAMRVKYAVEEEGKDSIECPSSLAIDNSPEAIAGWLSKDALVQLIECDDLKTVLKAKLAKRIGVKTGDLDLQKVAQKLNTPAARATDEYRSYVNFMSQRRQGKKVW